MQYQQQQQPSLHLSPSPAPSSSSFSIVLERHLLPNLGFFRMKEAAAAAVCRLRC
jgi:hypothetical protein